MRLYLLSVLALLVCPTPGHAQASVLIRSLEALEKHVDGSAPLNARLRIKRRARSTPQSAICNACSRGGSNTRWL